MKAINQSISSIKEKLINLNEKRKKKQIIFGLDQTSVSILKIDSVLSTQNSFINILFLLYIHNINHVGTLIIKNSVSLKTFRMKNNINKEIELYNFDKIIKYSLVYLLPL